MTGSIEQPWNDDRLKMNGVFIGCVKKENADHIMRMQEELASLRVRNADLLSALESLLSAVQASGMDSYGTVTEDSEMAIRNASAP